MAKAKAGSQQRTPAALREIDPTDVAIQLQRVRTLLESLKHVSDMASDADDGEATREAIALVSEHVTMIACHRIGQAIADLTGPEDPAYGKQTRAWIGATSAGANHG